MEEKNIYQDISQRTNGDIYIGVVGPVRTGKSTFIKKFMDSLVIPNMESTYQKDRAIDELPQSASGRTIMTTEPKFIPEEAAKITIGKNGNLKVRMIDCVGYIVPSALGYIENDTPRMVKTPWFDEAIPFNMAAEIGTKKVITEHSTIGLVITTDGSITDIDRDEYEEAEERVIKELKEINKPFIVLLNTMYPQTAETADLVRSLTQKYGVPVMPVDCAQINENEIKMILAQILFEFPAKEIKMDMPKWVSSLESDHWLRSSIFSSIKEACKNISKIRDAEDFSANLMKCEHIQSADITNLDLGTGETQVRVELAPDLFYRVLGEKTGLDIKDEAGLMNCILDLASTKDKFKKIQEAYDDVSETGYGIVLPSMNELTLEEPEIIKQGGKYGIKLKASAPSIHMMKTNIQTEVTPIVGSEEQSEDLIKYLLNEFEENPSKIWESNIFGKSLHELVNEGLHTKLNRMPNDARGKITETIERIINDGCNGLICILI